MDSEHKLGLAFQGGSFLAGAIATGVVTALLREGEFHRATAFSGTSAGALVAALCWRHKLQQRTRELPEHLFAQWMANACGLIPNETTATVLKLADRWLLLNPLYFKVKELFFVPVMHHLFEQWVVEHVEPEAIMAVLFDTYLGEVRDTSGIGWRRAVEQRYEADEERVTLAIGTAEIESGRVVTIDDLDLFHALVEAYATALDRGLQGAAAREHAVRAAARYMTLALMTSGSLDTVNGITRIDTVAGIDNLDRLHRGTYLDGAYSQNPPIAPLTKADVDEIWVVEIFPERCDRPLTSNEKREDRKEELLQNAPVQHQHQFINNLNFWLKTGQLRELDADELRRFEERLNSDADWRNDVIDLFKRTTAQPTAWRDEQEVVAAIRQKVRRRYRQIRTRTIALPTDLQPLTDAARIVNSPWFILYMMLRGYSNTLDFLGEACTE